MIEKAVVVRGGPALRRGLGSLAVVVATVAVVGCSSRGPSPEELAAQRADAAASRAEAAASQAQAAADRAEMAAERADAIFRKHMRK